MACILLIGLVLVLALASSNEQQCSGRKGSARDARPAYADAATYDGRLASVAGLGTPR
jgi:hypothetical protein